MNDFKFTANTGQKYRQMLVPLLWSTTYQRYL